MECLVHELLECAWYIGESKWHYLELKKTELHANATLCWCSGAMHIL